MSDAEEIGRRVIAALDAGRAKARQGAQKRATALRALVLELAAVDAAAGRPARGRPGRVTRKLNTLGTRVNERHVRRILDSFSCMSD